MPFANWWHVLVLALGILSLVAAIVLWAAGAINKRRPD